MVCNAAVHSWLTELAQAFCGMQKKTNMLHTFAKNHEQFSAANLHSGDVWGWRLMAPSDAQFFSLSDQHPCIALNAKGLQEANVGGSFVGP